jgi:hypothetical protein
MNFEASALCPVLIGHENEIQLFFVSRMEI